MQNEPLLRPGQLLEARYRLGPLLARGGFGEVYEAYDLQLERRVALKYIFQPLDPAQLQNEVKILATHAERLLFMPNVYGFWQATGGVGFFIVMEFVEGPTLNERRPLPWPPEQVIAFLRNMLRNLADLHRHGIVHCDIKPVNIKATPDYQLSHAIPYRLLDFGIARQHGQTVISGASPHYAAPEQHGLGAMKLDHRVDLYALGATAYFLLTGHKPADSRNRYTALSRDDADGLRPPSSLLAGIPPGLEAMLLDLLQLDRSRRPADAAAALALLEQRLVVPPEPSLVGNVPPSTVTELVDGRSAEMHVAPPTLLTLLPVPTVDPLSHRVLQSGRSTTGPPTRGAEPGMRTPLPPAATPQAPPRSATLLDQQGGGVITGIAWDPQGEGLLIATTLGIYRYAISGAECALWHPTSSVVHQLGVTHHGSHVVYRSNEQIWLLPIDQRAAAVPVETRLSDGQLLAASLSATVAIVGDDKLRLASLSEPDDALTLGLPAQIVGRVVALSADGQVVAFGVSDQVFSFSLRGEQQQITGVPHPLHDLALSATGDVMAIVSQDTVAIWQAGDAAAQFFTHPGGARVALSSDGDLLAVASPAGVALRRSTDGRPLPALATSDLADVCFLAFCPHDHLLAAATPTELCVWRLADRSLLARLTTFGPVGTWLAACSDTAFVSSGPELRAWAIQDDRLVVTQALPIEQPAQGISSGGGWLASAEGTALFLRAQDSLAAAEPRLLLPGQRHGLGLSPDGSILVVAGTDAIHIGATDQVILNPQIPLGNSGDVEHVVFSADCGYVAIHSRGLVAVHTLADGAEVCTVRSRGSGNISALALSPDGTQLVVAHGGSLVLWELSNGRARPNWQQAYDGQAPHHLTFAADGSYIVALQHTEASVWQIGGAGIDSQPIRCAHNDRITDALLLREGHRLVTASADGTLRLWALD